MGCDGVRLPVIDRKEGDSIDMFARIISDHSGKSRTSANDWLINGPDGNTSQVPILKTLNQPWVELRNPRESPPPSKPNCRPESVQPRS